MTIPSPILAQFTDWFEQAANHPNIKHHHAMHLATGGVDDRVSGRMVLLKEYDVDGFVFFTDYNSRKSMELTENSNAALTLYWEPLGRQIRIEGVVEKVSDEQSDIYFASRPRESQLAAWASEQSEPLVSREKLLERFKEYEVRFLKKEVPRPPNWGGWCVVPDRIEFWQEGEHRLHERHMHQLIDNQWQSQLLNP